MRTNTVVVLHRPGALDAAKQWVASSGVGADGIRYETSTEEPRALIDIIGGNAYFIGSGTRCSVGFAVTGGFVTAGHCGNTGASTTQPSGNFAGSSFPGNDYAWVRVAAGNTPRPSVNRYPGTVSVAGSQAAGVGASVCRSGSTTGWHCGTINALGASVTYPQGTVTGLIRTNVCAEPGDSGGSLLAGNQAQGVTSGGSGNCSSGGATFFQPVNEILQAYGLTLTVIGGTHPATDRLADRLSDRPAAGLRRPAGLVRRHRLLAGEPGVAQRPPLRGDVVVRRRHARRARVVGGLGRPGLLLDLSSRWWPGRVKSGVCPGHP